MIKRNNWTNAEVRKILDGCRMVGIKENDEYCDIWNEAIQQAILFFDDFERDPNDPREFGAKAFDTETYQVVHIGTMPPQ